MEQHQYEEVIKRLDTMQSALVGNPLTNDGGIIGEVREIKATTKNRVKSPCPQM